MTIALYRSPIGALAVETDGGALVGLRFVEGQTGLTWPTCPTAEATVRWLAAYFSGEEPSFLPPLYLQCTPFQRRVWQELLKIPYGQTVSYGELARRVECRSAQAVGQAVGHNPVAVIVPCHRVVGSDGTLTGYAYGLERKQYLLQLENNNTTTQ